MYGCTTEASSELGHHVWRTIEMGRMKDGASVGRKRERQMFEHIERFSQQVLQFPKQVTKQYKGGKKHLIIYIDTQ